MNKKSILSVSLLLLVTSATLLFYSCRKESSNSSKGIKSLIALNTNATNVAHTNIIKENDYLYFSDLAVFDSTLNQLGSLNDSLLSIWESFYPGYGSMRSYYELTESVLADYDIFLSPCDDDILATVINTYGIVRVDSVAFLLDFADSAVYEVYPVTSANINVLKLKNEVNNDTMYVMKYSMNNEIFFPSGYEQQEALIMKNGNTVKLGAKRGFKKWWKKIFNKCDDHYAKSTPIKGSMPYTDVNNSTTFFKYNWKVKYQKAGLRFSVLWKVKHSKKNGEGHWKKFNGQTCVAGEASNKEYCGNWKYKNVVCTHSFPPFGTTSNYNYTKYRDDVYHSVHALSQIQFNFNIFFQNMTDPIIIYSTPSYVLEDN